MILRNDDDILTHVMANLNVVCVFAGGIFFFGQDLSKKLGDDIPESL